MPKTLLHSTVCFHVAHQPGPERLEPSLKKTLSIAGGSLSQMIPISVSFMFYLPVNLWNVYSFIVCNCTVSPKEKKSVFLFQQ